MSQTVQPTPSDQGASGPAQFDRSMGLVSNFALGFTYLSPLGAITVLLPLGLTTAGPPSIWWIVIVALGQLTVALIFGEIVSQYPITGGIYPWARRLWGRRYAWMAAWVYLCALVVTITSVAEFTAPVVMSLFGFTGERGITLLIAIAVLLLGLFLNLSGTRNLARVARLGFFAEISGVIGYGLYLLLFERHNSFSVLFDSMGVAADGSYVSAFLLASLTGLFLFYGFEACGDVAEEVVNPAREIPKAMILTIFFGFVSAFLAFLGFVLAAPNLQKVVDGGTENPYAEILSATVGDVGSKVFLVIGLTALLSCVLSLEAALSRLTFSFARDDMMPGSGALAKLTGEKTPRNAMILASVAPMLVCVWVYFFPSSLGRVTSFAILGIYVCFQMVVFAALRQRRRGWKPAGPFSLGGAGLTVNITALLYGLGSMYILARPGDASLAFVDRWVVLLGMGVVLVSGLIYMLVARPYARSDGPEGDALEVAAAIRRGEESVV